MTHIIPNPGVWPCIMNTMWPWLNPNICVFDHCVINHVFNNKYIVLPAWNTMCLCSPVAQIDPRNYRFINVIRILWCIAKGLFKTKSTSQTRLLSGLMNQYCEQSCIRAQVGTELANLPVDGICTACCAITSSRSDAVPSQGLQQHRAGEHHHG